MKGFPHVQGLLKVANLTNLRVPPWLKTCGFYCVFFNIKKEAHANFGGRIRKAHFGAECPGKGGKGEGKLSLNQIPIPEQYQNTPAGDLTRPGPRPGEFIYIFCYDIMHISIVY